MLTLTGQAVDAIRSLTTQEGLPADTGLRIAPQAGGAGSLALSITEGPEMGDEVIEEEGVRVYVQPDAAAVLNDKSLDAEVSEEGVSFRLGLQQS